jgi:hypothetical protein
MLVVVLVFIGEISVWHINNFETDYPYTTMYLSRDGVQEEMKSNLLTKASENNVGFFLCDKTINSLFSHNLIIYTTTGIPDLLSVNSNIRSGRYNSILLGEINIQIRDFNEINDLHDFDTYYMVGNADDIIKFKQSLVDQYGGRFPQFPSAANNDRLVIGLICSVMFFFFILLTLYEIAFIKKEITLRVVLGESLPDIVTKNVVIDLVCYSAVVLSLFVGLGNVTDVNYCWNVTAVIFALFLIFNSLVYFKLIFSNYKQDIVSQANAMGLVRTSYLFKIASVALVILIMTGNILISRRV